MKGTTRNSLANDWAVASPPELAALLRIAPKKVLGWIHGGELTAANVAANPNSRPVFRVARADFDKFWGSRSSTPMAKPERRRPVRSVGFREFL